MNLSRDAPHLRDCVCQGNPRLIRGVVPFSSRILIFHCDRGASLEVDHVIFHLYTGGKPKSEKFHTCSPNL